MQKNVHSHLQLLTKNWKQNPSTLEWVNKLWCINRIMEYYGITMKE